MNALAQEFHLLWRSRGARALIVVWIALLGYALLDAATFLHARVAAIEAHEATRGELPPTGEIDAHRARTPATLPPAPLTILAIGQQDLDPFAASVDLLSRPDTMLRNHELQSPMTLATGRLDATFAVVFLMPLVLLGLAYGQLGEDRENSRLALVGASGVGPTQLLWRRLVAQALAVAAPLVALTGAAVLLAGAPGAGAAWIAWLGVAVAYLAFWTTAAALLAGTAGTSAQGALRLAVAWVVIVVLFPVGIRSLADAVAPLPTRIATIAEMRAAELEIIENSDDVLGRFMDDHPELAAAGDGGRFAWLRASYARSRALAERVAALEDANAERVARNARLAERLAYVSPAALATQALGTAAGADGARVVEFERQLAAFEFAHDRALLPHAFAGTALQKQRIAQLPAFVFEEPPPRTPWAPWIALLGYAALAGLMATRRSDRAPVGAQPVDP